MAKKKPEADAAPKPNSLVVRGSVEWREWLREAADHDRAQSVADYLDRAAAAYARQIGFKKGAPKR